jgi:hypothetical protein
LLVTDAAVGLEDAVVVAERVVGDGAGAGALHVGVEVREAVRDPPFLERAS